MMTIDDIALLRRKQGRSIYIPSRSTGLRQDLYCEAISGPLKKPLYCNGGASGTSSSGHWGSVLNSAQRGMLLVLGSMKQIYFWRKEQYRNARFGLCHVAVAGIIIPGGSSLSSNRSARALTPQSLRELP
jgi:hypothetical protein